MAYTLLFLFFLSIFSSAARAAVPVSAQFKFVNEGEFGDFVVEYDGNYRVLSIFNSPFQLCFYNTTPNAFTLALRMATTRSESLRVWVWEANRGNPVRENATLNFGSDGNLVLADADGRIAWQTNTANKGVVGLKLLSNGNLVLHDAKNKFIWQSFDYPTDTLLVGQSLVVGKTKLVSRLSEKVNSNGPYSLVLEANRFALYYKSLVYFTSTERFGTLSNVSSLTLTATPNPDQGLATDITLDNLVLARPKYDGTLSFLRLGIDGNLKVYTYSDLVDWGAWDNTLTVFSKDSWETECQLPERCGEFGVCEEDQCVACPSPKGLLGWSKVCRPEKVSCRPGDFGYYKVEGVDHFASKLNAGVKTKESECGKKCTADCKCLGYFYHRETSRCWIAYELKTLSKVANLGHVGYIKTPNK